MRMMSSSAHVDMGYHIGSILKQVIASTFANSCSFMEACFFTPALMRSSLPWEGGRVCGDPVSAVEGVRGDWVKAEACN